jgi:putative PIN family toxin of toxin-antitoxin system
MIRVVLDTDVLIAARRSADGASNALLRRFDQGAFVALASVPLFFEYEAVLMRPEHLMAGNVTQQNLLQFLSYMAGRIEPVKLHYLWRPQLLDVADEMVLETAINGRADWIITFNLRHLKSATKFGIDVLKPNEALGRLR